MSIKKWFGMVIVCVCLWGMRAEAAEDLSEYDFSALQEVMDEALDTRVSFFELVTDIVQGNLKEIPAKFFTYLKGVLFAELSANKKGMLQVLLIAIMGAVFTNVSSVFKDSQVADTGFYITYLLMITTLSTVFIAATVILKDILEVMLTFMKVLIPAFFLAVSVAGGSLASIAYYEGFLLLITLIQTIFFYGLLPLTEGYVMLTLANHIMKEDYLSQLAGLMKKVVNLGMKGMLVLVFGMNLLQSMILPFVDSTKMSFIRKSIKIIPGLGAGADAAADLLLGSGVLIKNGIGVAALIALILLSAIPLLKLFLIAAMYHAAAVFIQPISDRRMLRCVEGVAKGAELLLKIGLTVFLLFFVTIAIICLSTNTLYYTG